MQLSSPSSSSFRFKNHNLANHYLFIVVTKAANGLNWLFNCTYEAIYRSSSYISEDTYTPFVFTMKAGCIYQDPRILSVVYIACSLSVEAFHPNIRHSFAMCPKGWFWRSYRQPKFETVDYFFYFYLYSLNMKLYTTEEDRRIRFLG